MQTILRGKNSEVAIDFQKPFVIIGERINPTGHKKLAEALKEGNFDYVRELATSQVANGADMLDVNVGVPGLDDVVLLPEVVKIVAETVDVPLCIDTPNPKALAAALKVAPGKVLVNSVNGEQAMLEAVLPLVKEHGAAVIGLTMDDDGIPHDAGKRLAIADKIMESASQLGIPMEDVVIDPLVMAVGSDSLAGVITLETIRLVHEKFDANINLGASNVSFGMPDRHTLNQAFLSLAMQVGATCAITRPGKLAPIIRATDLLLGRDDYGMRYIGYWREHQPKEG